MKHARAHTHTRARSRTHTRKHRSRLSQRERLEARLLYRGCLAFGTSKTAPGREVEKGQRAGGVTFWGLAWA